MTPRRAAAVFLALLPGALLPGIAPAQTFVPDAARLASPFLPAAPAVAGPAALCQPVPDPVRNLEGVAYYADAAFSRADPDRLRADEEAAKPLRDWLRAVQHDLARYRRGEAGAVACVLETLDAWARTGALLGGFNLQGSYHRKWTLAGAALAFVAVAEAPGLDPLKRGRTARWLREVALAVRPRYDRISAALINDTRNNHAAWAGLAIAAAGVAAGDRALLDWGIARLRAQLVQVDERGALPQELARGAMALHYHLFALEPIAALSRLAAANGIAMSDDETAALTRLRRFVLAAAEDPSRMAAVAGIAQDDPFLRGRTPLVQAAGLEVLQSADPDPAAEPALAPHRPYRSAWLGGDVTGWWR
ncbi:alginate lyase family protein [Roseomonas sp. CCTCC AB2023176]|uniref:alginate lyase family protein n=1 Tax=Roseomonas sp. CCTCC AB2023176 TaxID=3342640 RepID=UPI0035E2FB17